MQQCGCKPAPLACGSRLLSWVSTSRQAYQTHISGCKKRFEELQTTLIAVTATHLNGPFTVQLKDQQVIALESRLVHKPWIMLLPMLPPVVVKLPTFATISPMRLAFLQTPLKRAARQSSESGGVKKNFHRGCNQSVAFSRALRLFKQHLLCDWLTEASNVNLDSARHNKMCRLLQDWRAEDDCARTRPPP